MLLRPSGEDVRLVGRHVGGALVVVGAAMLLPAVVGLAAGEAADAWAFLLAAGVTTATGLAARLAPAGRELRAPLGLATVGAAWLVVPLFGALPLALSGHWASYLDAWFEAVSGFTTTGLTVARDVDHMPVSVNLWRHLIQGLGGQAMLVVLLTAFAAGSGRLGSLYGTGGREDAVLPGVRRAAAFALRIALLYALLGIPLLAALLVLGGLAPAEAPLHALALFLSAFDTSAFTLHSGSVAAYRSAAVEAVLGVLMLAGAFSYAIHQHLWEGRRSELVRSTEVRTVTASTAVLLVVLATGLARSGTFTTVAELHRHGLFQLVSAHTTAGLTTVPGPFLVADWGVLAPAALVTAMGVGGMTGSTAGGVKGLRIGIVLKGIRADIRRVLLPQDAVVTETYHDGVRQIVTGPQIRDAAVLLFLWLAMYLTGAILGLFHGYDLASALFESTAASSTAGFSVGVIGPATPTLLKLVHAGQMIAGRVEFVALFALAGAALSLVRGRA